MNEVLRMEILRPLDVDAREIQAVFTRARDHFGFFVRSSCDLSGLDDVCSCEGQFSRRWRDFGSNVGASSSLSSQFSVPSALILSCLLL